MSSWAFALLLASSPKSFFQNAQSFFPLDETLARWSFKAVEIVMICDLLGSLGLTPSFPATSFSHVHVCRGFLAWTSVISLMVFSNCEGPTSSESVSFFLPLAPLAPLAFALPSPSATTRASFALDFLPFALLVFNLPLLSLTAVVSSASSSSDLVVLRGFLSRPQYPPLIPGQSCRSSHASDTAGRQSPNLCRPCQRNPPRWRRCLYASSAAGF